MAAMNTLLAPTWVPLQAKVAWLQDPLSYPEPTSRVEPIETHCAFVFLTDHYAYKLKKPMRLDRMDNLLLSSRYHNCLEELRLNRRLAPHVYLEVVALRAGPAGHLSLTGGGLPVEWLVKMRRLPSDLLLDHALGAGKPIAQESIAAVGRLLSAFYQNQPAVTMTGRDYLGRLERQIDANGQALSDRVFALPVQIIHAALASQRQFLIDHTVLLGARATKVVEAHGDLRPEHVYIGTPPCVIDCLEFDRALRLLDPLEELAHLALECERLGSAWIGREVIDVYSAASGDRFDPALLEFYMTRRATQRALTAAWHLRDPAVRHLKDWTRLALSYLTRATTGRFNTCLR
ncbi:MAG TPA: hypothetical protein VK437_16635 [Steroidobacteraceae bacterium]|nr:hypothetical protein [Steroidobacteraceae bacterium]